MAQQQRVAHPQRLHLRGERVRRIVQARQRPLGRRDLEPRPGIALAADLRSPRLDLLAQHALLPGLGRDVDAARRRGQHRLGRGHVAVQHVADGLAHLLPHFVHLPRVVGLRVEVPTAALPVHRHPAELPLQPGRGRARPVRGDQRVLRGEVDDRVGLGVEQRRDRRAILAPQRKHVELGIHRPGVALDAVEHQPRDVGASVRERDGLHLARGPVKGPGQVAWQARGPGVLVLAAGQQARVRRPGVGMRPRDHHTLWRDARPLLHVGAHPRGVVVHDADQIERHQRQAAVAVFEDERAGVQGIGDARGPALQEVPIARQLDPHGRRDVNLRDPGQ